MILYSHQLYSYLEPHLGWFEHEVAHRETGDVDSDMRVDVLLFGLGRFGSTLASMLRKAGCRLLAIDFDPVAVQSHEREGYRTRYGDAEDPEFIATLPLENAGWVVSTLRDRALNRALVQVLKQQGYQGKIAVSSSTRQEADAFHGDGVSLVLVPYADAAKEAADKLIHQGLQHTVINRSGVGI
jgi:Trk K+ transport system NAD-binding subunit